MLADHVLLAEPYREGVAAGRDFAGESQAPMPALRRWAEREEALWQLLVRSPLREEAEALAELPELRALLPAFADRAYAEGFDDGVRQHLLQQAEAKFRVPARWRSVLRQSGRRELAAMLQALPRARTWMQFLAATASD